VEKLEHHILASLGSHGAVMIHLDHPHHDMSAETELPSSDAQPFTVAQATRFKQG
jgi:hypothetical protein